MMSFKKLITSSLLISLSFTALDVCASVASDVLAMTGNARAKLIWLRYQWCDSAYNPIAAYRSIDGENANKFTQLLVFDTQEGTERYLDKEVGQHFTPRITRKDGSHVIWSDSVNSCSWIRDYAGSAPKRKFIDVEDFVVVHCRYDAATNKEYVYTLSGDRKKLSIIPLKSDYTADIGARTTAYTANNLMKYSLGVSADGKYLGTLIPWPNTMIVDMGTGTKYDRHVSDPFGCQPNMAPDNSYRFFYLRSDHDVIRMWGPELSNDNWDVPIDKMPGNKDFNNSGYDHDCVLPRWTNNPRFFTNSYPLVIWNYSDGRIFDSNASALKADQLKDSCGTGVFCLGKFTSDYKAVETYVRITTCDVRKRDVVGDAWIATTPSAVNDIVTTPKTAAHFGWSFAGSTLKITTQHSNPVEVTVTSMSGRIMAHAVGQGSALCNFVNKPDGVFLVTLQSNGIKQTMHGFFGKQQSASKLY